MQINSSWLPQLAKFWGVREDVALLVVRDDACMNVGVGTWILQAALAKNENLQKAISVYHSSAHHLGAEVSDEEYANKVIKLMDLYKPIRTPEDLFVPAPVPVNR